MVYLKDFYSHLIYLQLTKSLTQDILLNMKYRATVAYGDSYEAKIINVMLEIVFKKCPKQCFLETLD